MDKYKYFQMLFGFLILKELNANPFQNEIICSQSLPAQNEQFPHIVLIKSKGELLCRGTLINENWVLTSTHCINNNYNIPLHDIDFVLGNKIQEIRRKPQKVMVNSDIALIKMNKPIIATSIVAPIELATKELSKNINCVISSFEKYINNKLSIIYWNMVNVSTHIYSQGDFYLEDIICDKGIWPLQNITENGTPLLCNNHVYGIYSITKPRVFINILNYSKWILNVTQFTTSNIMINNEKNLKFRNRTYFSNIISVKKNVKEIHSNELTSIDNTTTDETSETEDPQSTDTFSPDILSTKSPETSTDMTETTTDETDKTDGTEETEDHQSIEPSNPDTSPTQKYSIISPRTPTDMTEAIGGTNETEETEDRQSTDPLNTNTSSTEKYSKTSPTTPTDITEVTEKIDETEETEDRQSSDPIDPDTTSTQQYSTTSPTTSIDITEVTEKIDETEETEDRQSSDPIDPDTTSTQQYSTSSPRTSTDMTGATGETGETEETDDRQSTGPFYPCTTTTQQNSTTTPKSSTETTTITPARTYETEDHYTDSNTTNTYETPDSTPIHVDTPPTTIIITTTTGSTSTKSETESTTISSGEAVTNMTSTTTTDSRTTTTTLEYDISDHQETTTFVNVQYSSAPSSQIISIYIYLVTVLYCIAYTIL